MLGSVHGEVEFVVLRRSEGTSYPSAIYQRVNTIQRMNLLTIWLHEEMQGGRGLGWEMKETGIR